MGAHLQRCAVNVNDCLRPCLGTLSPGLYHANSVPEFDEESFALVAIMSEASDMIAA